MKLFKSYTFVDYATQVYLVLVAVLILAFHNETVRFWRSLVALHVTGMLLIHAMIRWHTCKPEAEPLNFLRHFYPVLLYVYFFAETGWLNRMFVREFQDPAVIHWEQALFGCQPGVLFMQRFPSLLISEVLYASYFSYYLMIAGIGLAFFFRDRQQLFHYLSVLSFVFYICYTIYIFLPVIGPRVFLNEFSEYQLPQQIMALAPDAYYPHSVKSGPFFRIMNVIYTIFEAPGAAFPSSHVAAATCTLYFSFRYLRKIFPAHLVAVVLLCLSTVYGRYHYAVDVLAGLATGALLVPLGNWLYLRLGSQGRPAGQSAEPRGSSNCS